MDIRKVGGNTEFGLNADEAHMAYTGFANPTTYGSASQDLFLDRYMPYRDAHEGEYEQILARGQVIELLWLPSSMAKAVAIALRQYRTDGNSSPSWTLSADPPYRADSPDLIRAQAAAKMALTAENQLEELAA
jgi:hypothetical protein